MHQCPHCGLRLRERYICEPWSRRRGGGKFLGAQGFAKANFDRHVKSCKKKQEEKEKA
jgi:hypothetical protein